MPKSSRQSSTTAPVQKTSKSNTYGYVFCTLLIILASIVLQTHDTSPLNEYLSKTIAKTKPYSTFEEFYPHYLREHSQVVTRQWHYVGTSLFLLSVLFNPLLVLPMLSGGLSAYSVIPFFRHVSNGIGEMVLFLGVYLIGARLLTRSWLRTFLPLLLGYGFAWIGHFGFEKNKPATFIYPTFSLMGDFRMIYDAIQRQSF